MKKIAILTFHRACNYGAFLQAYALQETIDGIEDANATIIDYVAEYIDARYSPLYLMRKKGNLAKKIVKTLFQYFGIIKRNRVFFEARKQYFHITKANITKDKLKNYDNEEDAYIVGSDQVWNKEIIGDDTTFYLDFVSDNSKKYSYAASTGKTDLSESEKYHLLDHICTFKEVSIREASVVDIIKKDIPNAVCSIDPVFLFSSNKWREFKKSSKIRHSYILFFMMGQGNKALNAYKFALNLAQEKRVQLVYLSDNDRWYKFREAKHYGIASPEEFVDLIDLAECVVTNSFHATAFSILLHKEFYVETQIDRKGRIIDLLKTTGLQDRGLTEGKRASTESNIDWDAVDKSLESIISQSKEYLCNIVDEIQQ